MTKAKPKTKTSVPTAGSSSPLKQSLSGLAVLRDQLPPGPVADPVTAQGAGEPHDAKTESSVYARAKKIVVRRERKGHGGKTVTRVAGLLGSTAELETVTREMKRRLGCGATLEGGDGGDDGDLLIQGDLCDRVVAFLESQGARHIVRGN